MALARHQRQRRGEPRAGAQAEPTLEQARVLGFELARRDDGRLGWTSAAVEYDGGSHPRADEREALESLVEELA